MKIAKLKFTCILLQSMLVVKQSDSLAISVTSHSEQKHRFKLVENVLGNLIYFRHIYNPMETKMPQKSQVVKPYHEDIAVYRLQSIFLTSVGIRDLLLVRLARGISQYHKTVQAAYSQNVTRYAGSNATPYWLKKSRPQVLQKQNLMSLVEQQRNAHWLNNNNSVEHLIRVQIHCN